MRISNKAIDRDIKYRRLRRYTEIVNRDVNQRHQPKRETSSQWVYNDQLESDNPFLGGTLSNTIPETKDVDDIFDEHLSVVRNARPKVRRYIPWFKIIMFSILTIFLAGMVIGIISIIFLLS
jgi:hypothetical protein